MGAMFDKIKQYFDSGLWSIERVKNMVVKGVITKTDYKTIVGERYKK